MIYPLFPHFIKFFIIIFKCINVIKIFLLNRTSFFSKEVDKLDNENLWINGVILLNAHGYANPILSVVVTSSIIISGTTR